MTRIRTLIASALLIFPLALSAAAPTDSARLISDSAASSAPGYCVLIGGQLHCF